MDNPTVMIKDIRQGMKNLVMTVIVLDIGAPVQVKEREVRTLKVADSTACINLSLWGEAGNHLVPGDIIRLSKAHVNVYRNCVTLLNGKSCEIDKVGDFCMVFNEQLNMSEPTAEAVTGERSGKNGGGPPHTLGQLGGGGGGGPPLGGGLGKPGAGGPPRPPSQPPPQPEPTIGKTQKLNSGNNGNKTAMSQRVGAAKGNQPRSDRR